MTIAARVRAVCEHAMVVTDVAGRADLSALAVAARERLDEPLRVAVAGRIKAGKSTLLNALVGEPIAATDAGECTRLVTWYHEAIGYRASARLLHGGEREVLLRRDDAGRSSIDLLDVDPRDIASIDVGWPSSALREITFIDTPGLASIDAESSQRTRDFLAPDDTDGTDRQADAVIYLMRHLHQRDAEFLEAFSDRSLVAASPANAIAVLSRADEIGAGRIDAMHSATAIAARYTLNNDVRMLCAAVVPVAGLLAESAQSLTERDAADLRTLAELAPQELDDLLLSVERFCRAESSALAPESRRALLERFGVFGIRTAVAHLRAGESTAAALSHRLLVVSGLPALRALVRDRFGRQATALKARSALRALHGIAGELSDQPAAAESLRGELERVEAALPELAQLRASTLVHSGLTKLAGTDQTEAIGALAGVVAAQPLEAAERWRVLATNPLFDPTTVEVCDTVARAYERQYLASIDGELAVASQGDASR